VDSTSLPIVSRGFGVSIICNGGVKEWNDNVLRWAAKSMTDWGYVFGLCTHVTCSEH